MARTDTFSRPSLWVQATRSAEGIAYVAWKPQVSQGFGDRKALLKWLAWPAKTPTGDELRQWLDGLEPSAGIEQAAPEPLPGLDPSDPQHETRTII